MANLLVFLGLSKISEILIMFYFKMLLLRAKGGLIAGYILPVLGSNY